MVSSGTRNEVDASRPSPNRPGGPDQGGGVEAGEHLAPGRVGGIEVAIGQPADKPAIRPGRGQPMPVVAGEDLLQQDRQRPAIEHDVVDWSARPGAGLSAVRINATRNAGGSARSQTAARSAAHSRWICSSRSASFVAEVDVLPGRHGIGGDDLYRLVELVAESGGQVGVAVDHRVHRVAQPVGVQRAGHGDVELHRIHVVVAAVRGAGVEEQPLLQRGQRQDVGDPVLLVQFVDLLLGEPGRGDIGGGQPAAAVLRRARRCRPGRRTTVG